MCLFGRVALDDLALDDFEKLRSTQISKTRDALRCGLGNEINRVKAVPAAWPTTGWFRSRFTTARISEDHHSKTLRKARAERGPKIFEVMEIRQMVSLASQPLCDDLVGDQLRVGAKRHFQLAANSAIDLASGWLTYPRPKTGDQMLLLAMARKTAKAIKAAIAIRPEPPRTPRILAWHSLRNMLRGWTRMNDNGTVVCGVTQQFRKLLKSSGINGERGFYCLRRGFETIGGDSRDQVAVDFVMG